MIVLIATMTMNDLLTDLLTSALSSVGIVPLIVVIILLMAVWAIRGGDLDVGGLLGAILSGSDDDNDDDPLEIDIEIEHETEKVDVENRPANRVSDDDMEALNQ